MTFVEQIEKRMLRRASAVFIDRLVFLPPIDRQTQAMPKHTECVFVLFDQIEAGFDEIWTRDQARWFLSRLRRGAFELHALFVGRVRIASNVEIVLDTPFRRKPVVIPTHWIKDVHAGHAFVTHDDIRLCIGKDVAYMKRTRGCRRRRIDDECFFARARGVVVIHAITLPGGIPPRLDFERFKMLRQSCRIDRSGARPRSRCARALGLAHLVLSMTGANRGGPCFLGCSAVGSGALRARA